MSKSRPRLVKRPPAADELETDAADTLGGGDGGVRSTGAGDGASTNGKCSAERTAGESSST